jgi:hypothetical protein
VSGTGCNVDPGQVLAFDEALTPSKVVALLLSILAIFLHSVRARPRGG